MPKRSFTMRSGNPAVAENFFAETEATAGPFSHYLQFRKKADPSMHADQLSPDEIFAEAIKRPQGTERAKYLDHVYGQDANTRERMERLLLAHVEAESFLEVPAADSMATLHQERPISEQAGTVIGSYKLR